MQKTSYVTTLEDGTKILSPEVFEAIVDKLFAKVDFNYNIHRGSKSYDWYEPDDPTTVEVYAKEVSLSIEELKEFMPTDEEMLELLEYAVDEPDQYDFWEDAVKNLFYDGLESGIPSFRVCSHSLNLKFKTDKGLSIEPEVDDYEFDLGEYDFDMDPRNEYDPCEDW